MNVIWILHIKRILMKKAKKKRIVYLSTVICFLFLVLSTATYAWFEQGNRLKVTNLSLLAGGSGILIGSSRCLQKLHDMKIFLKKKTKSNIKAVAQNVWQPL